MGEDGRIVVIDGYFNTPMESRWSINSIGEDIVTLDLEGHEYARARLMSLGLKKLRAIDVAIAPDGELLILLAPREGVGRYQIARLVPSSNETIPTPMATTESPQAPAPANQGPCRISGDKRASPSEIWLGEEVTVTLSVFRTCPGPPRQPADIVLVLDTSGSMAGQPATKLGEATEAFIASLDLTLHRVGIVTFADGAEVRVPLTNDAIALSMLPESWGAEGMTNMHAGMRLANGLLESARPNAARAIVFMSDGDFTVGPSPLALADEARRSGTTIFAVGLGNVEVRFLIRFVGDLARFYPALSANELPTLFRQIAGAVSSRAGGATLDDVLHRDVALNETSVLPRPHSHLGANVRWMWPYLQEQPITLTYRVRPLRTGVVPTNEDAYVDYLDMDGLLRRYVYPVPLVLVKAPVTSTPTRSPTEVPTATPFPTSTAVSFRADIYLPVALSEPACKPGREPVDVAVVIDASSSMLELSAGGLTKIAAARDAAGAFLEALRLSGGDQASVITFNEKAVVIGPLGSEISRLRVALQQIAIAPLTCLVCGVDAAVEELQGPRHRSSNRSVMIVLTDGRSNPRPASEAVESATRAKRAGVQLFTIGLGSDLDLEALRDIASLPSYFYQAPSVSDLGRIYSTIAIEIPCPAGNYWGRR